MTIRSITGSETDTFRVTVSGRLTELRDEAEVLKGEIEERQRRLANLAQLINRLEEVLELSTIEDAPDAKPVLRHANYKEICNLVAQILAEHDKKPVHFRQLADEVRRRGIRLGGADPGRTLVAKLVWDDRFIRPERKGYYALREDYPDAPNVGERKNQRGGQSNTDGNGETNNE